MKASSIARIRVARPVERALADDTPVVALESTVIAHGLPYPINLETALACEQAIRQGGATPATLGIIDGVPTVGLTADEIRLFAMQDTGDGTRIEKAGTSNIAGLMLRKAWGATTVAASVRLAKAAGIRVFSTGGIGGVHRGAAESFDVSGDLTALANTPVVCVCAGAKAILDLPKTLEYLETAGVPVVGYGTEEFPAFYSRRSGLGVDIRVSGAEEAASLAEHHWSFGARSAVLVCVPVPAEVEIEASEIASTVDEAMAKAARRGVRGRAVTPFLLAELEKLTGGRTVEANRALLVNNATAAACISHSLSKLSIARGIN